MTTSKYTRAAAIFSLLSLPVGAAEVIGSESSPPPPKHILIDAGTVVECKPFPGLDVLDLAIKVAQRGLPIVQQFTCSVTEGQALPHGFRFEGDLKQVKPQHYAVVWERISVNPHGWLKWDPRDFGFDTTANKTTGNLRLQFQKEMSVSVPAADMSASM